MHTDLIKYQAYVDCLKTKLDCFGCEEKKSGNSFLVSFDSNEALDP